MRSNQLSYPAITSFQKRVQRYNKKLKLPKFLRFFCENNCFLCIFWDIGIYFVHKISMHRYFLYIFLSILFFSGINQSSIYAKAKNNVPDSLQILYFQVGEESFLMKRVEGGVFVMGGTREQHREPISTDLPTHTVALDAYYIANTEVTQALWKTIMPEWEFVEEYYSPSLPISYVNWHDCQEFIRRLDSITGLQFRLPTEAEWEFAARGGNNSKGFRFAGSNYIDTVSWSSHNAGFRKHRVGEKLPNELGLYDMSGNVFEWCQDKYYKYVDTNAENKQTIVTNNRIFRGGSWYYETRGLRVSFRYYNAPTSVVSDLGFRLAL